MRRGDEASMKYSFDTSSFISLNDYYPLDIFPTVWQRIDALVNEGVIVATIMVYDEIKPIDDDIHAYLKDRSKEVFQLLDRTQEQIVDDIVNVHFPQWVKPHSTSNKADPFVVALAKSYSLTVVTEEKRNPNKTTIPRVCETLGVRWINLLEFLREIKLEV